MEYSGKLYGKMDKYIFPLEATTDDIEEIERENERLKSQMKELKEFVTLIFLILTANSKTNTTKIIYKRWTKRQNTEKYIRSHSSR